MCEPLSVGVHAVRRGQVSPGMDVAVIGAGPIGELEPPSYSCCSSIAQSGIDAQSLHLAVHCVLSSGGPPSSRPQAEQRTI